MTNSINYHIMENTTPKLGIIRLPLKDVISMQSTKNLN